MRRLKIIIRLIVLCFITGLALYFISKPDVEQTMRGKHGKTVFNTAFKGIDHIVLEPYSGKKIEFQRTLSGWEIVFPEKRRALEAPILQMLDTFERAPVIDFIDRQDIKNGELGKNLFGLCPYKCKFTLSSQQFRASLEIGDYNTFSNGLFTTFNFDNGVFVTTPEIGKYCNAKLADFADRRLIHTNIRKVNTIVLKRKEQGDIKFVRSGGHNWMITQPVEVIADWEKLDVFLRTLAAATDEHCGENDSVAFSGGYGLGDDEAVSVQLFCQNELTGQTFYFGNKVSGDAALVYARGPENTVMAVTNTLYETAVAPLDDFRDRRILPTSSSPSVKTLSVDSPVGGFTLRRGKDNFWEILSPVSEPADPAAAAGIIDTLLSLKATAFKTFDANSATSRLFSATLNADANKLRLNVFAAPESAGLLAVVPENSATMYMIPQEAVSNICAACSDPRIMISKNILSLREESVRAVTISRKDGTVEKIERKNGKWTAPDSTLDPHTTSIERFLGTVAALRAESVEAVSVTPETPFDAETEIVFDLDDAETPKRVLLLGPRTETGVRAMTRGHDTVFLLPPETVLLFTRPLLAPEAPHGTLSDLGEPELSPDKKTSK